MASPSCFCGASDNDLLQMEVQILTSIFDRLAQINSSISGSVPGALTDRSGTIAAGSVSQQAMAANPIRRYLNFQNNSVGDLWINFTTAATLSQPSYKVTPNGYFIMEDSFISNEAFNVIGATAGQTYTLKEG